MNLKLHYCKKKNNVFQSNIVFFLLLSFLLFPSACKNKVEEPEGNGDGELIIISKGQPIVKKKERLYSFPPNVESVDLSEYTTEEIENMAQDLDMKGFYEGNRRYYKNKKHMIFVPEKIPTIYKHKDQYFDELNELW